MGGVKGMLPLGCLPLWGRDGVPLQMAYKRKRITGNRISTVASFLLIPGYFRFFLPADLDLALAITGAHGPDIACHVLFI